MNFFENSILKLQEKRKIFHLKLSLGFIIKELFPEFEVRLEKPIAINMIDINGEKLIVRAPIDNKDDNSYRTCTPLWNALSFVFNDQTRQYLLYLLSNLPSNASSRE
jgi:hypothetical protein